MNEVELGIFEAKTHFSDVIDRVEKGQAFIITKRGKRVAELRPVQQEKKRLTRGCAAHKDYYMAPDFCDTPEGFEEYT
jgi:prevent-host-death family protein